jgi:hypothetical protein
VAAYSERNAEFDWLRETALDELFADACTDEAISELLAETLPEPETELDSELEADTEVADAAVGLTNSAAVVTSPRAQANFLAERRGRVRVMTSPRQKT